MSLQEAAPLLLVGCGKMGSALLTGWLQGGLARDSVTIIEPFEGQREALAADGLHAVATPAEVAADFAPKLVVMAVKPQQMDAVLADCKPLLRPESLVLSIAAGCTLARFEAGLGAETAVVRSMPNTPAAVGRGISVLVANKHVDAAGRAICEALMQAAGEVAWVEDEALIDPVTAVSGGGPAYVFLLIETLAEAGVAAGLSPELAARLARVTVAGAGELVHQASESPSTLRENVTSPGGTTLEALKILMAEDGLQPLMTRAIAAASRRSRELAS